MISGGAKFYEPNKIAFDLGTSITVTSGEAAKDYALDRNKLTKWRSVGSTDTNTETITIDFIEASNIDRIFVAGFNLKEFTIQYNNGSGLVDFTNVVGIGGALVGGISEAAFALDTAYYEFDSVSTSQIVLTATKTQVADSEKQITEIIATEEIGTLDGYPIIKSIKIDRNSRVKKTLSGRRSIQKSLETFRFKMEFKDYPSSYGADIDLMYSLFDRDNSFIVWLCGGRQGSNYFGKQLRGWGLQDVIKMNIEKAVDTGYRNNVYTNPVNLKVDFSEVI